MKEESILFRSQDLLKSFLEGLSHVWVVVQFKKIDKRLKACHNALLDPDSQAFKDAAAAKANREAEKRRIKVGLPGVAL